MLPINPFRLSDDGLLEFSMKEKNTEKDEAFLYNYGVLGTDNEEYNPYFSLVSEALAGVKGATVDEFDDKLLYKKPVLGNIPNDLLMKLNVREQMDSFDREEQLKQQIDTLFNPVGDNAGDSPEQRARNRKIELLLSEITNFGVQYNLSTKQIEELKTNVLKGELPDYLERLSMNRSEAEKKKKQDAMDLVTQGTQAGEAPNGLDATIRDENGMADLGGEVESKDETGGQATQDTQDPAAAAGAAGGDGISMATDAIPESIVEPVKQVISELKRGFTKGGMSQASVKDTWKYLIEGNFVSNPDKLKNLLMMKPLPDKLDIITRMLSAGETIEEREAEFITRIIIDVINKEPFRINEKSGKIKVVGKSQKGKTLKITKNETE